MNNSLKQFISARRILKKNFLEFNNFISGKHFYCLSLNGESDHGLTITSDLSITCHCDDSTHVGKIGNLNDASLKNILGGKKASQFRHSLAKGQLPLLACNRCADLRTTRKKKTSFVLPKKILIENCSACNLHCTCCDRNSIAHSRKKSLMSIDDMTLIAKELQSAGVLEVHYFSLGEPFLSLRIKEELLLLRKYNPHLVIITSTNGSLVNNKYKQEAALLFDRIFFSIDDPDQKSVSFYQKGLDFSVAYNNMKQLVSFRGKRKKPLIE